MSVETRPRYTCDGCGVSVLAQSVQHEYAQDTRDAPPAGWDKVVVSGTEFDNCADCVSKVLGIAGASFLAEPKAASPSVTVTITPAATQQCARDAGAVASDLGRYDEYAWLDERELEIVSSILETTGRRPVMECDDGTEHVVTVDYRNSEGTWIARATRGGVLLDVLRNAQISLRQDHCKESR
jgi:hypothetical protein